MSLWYGLEKKAIKTVHCNIIPQLYNDKVGKGWDSQNLSNNMIIWLVNYEAGINDTDIIEEIHK